MMRKLDVIADESVVEQRVVDKRVMAMSTTPSKSGMLKASSFATPALTTATVAVDAVKAINTTSKSEMLEACPLT